MTDSAASSRRILKSSSIIGAASVINILIGLIRTKVLAILLGPAGVGLTGLYGSLIAMATSLASMGIGTMGARQIAEAQGKQDAHALAVVRHAMRWGALWLAVAGGFATWALRDVLAVSVLGDASQAATVGWLAPGVALSVAASAQTALIQGLRRIADMAKLSIGAAVLNTVLGLALLWQWGNEGLVGYVLVGPLASFLLGYWFVSRVPDGAAGEVSLPEMAAQWRAFLQLGVPFMAAGMVGTLVQLWIRVEVGNTLGTQALGHFQAAWTISMQYIGFVLAAMGADYFPRLTSVIHDKVAATRLVNEQTEIALLLSAPIFVVMIGLAPWVIRLLYSAEFSPAVDILRWQILGDVLKVASWPLGFVLLAAGAGKTFFLVETASLLVMGGTIAGLAPVLGLQSTGLAFLLCYAVVLPVVFWQARRRIAFAWQKKVFLLLLSILATCLLICLLGKRDGLEKVVAVLAGVVFGLHALVRFAHMSDAGGKVARISALSKKLLLKKEWRHEP